MSHWSSLFERALRLVIGGILFPSVIVVALVTALTAAGEMARYSAEVEAQDISSFVDLVGQHRNLAIHIGMLARQILESDEPAAHGRRIRQLAEAKSQLLSVNQQAIDLAAASPQQVEGGILGRLMAMRSGIESLAGAAKSVSEHKNDKALPASITLALLDMAIDDFEAEATAINEQISSTIVPDQQKVARQRQHLFRLSILGVLAAYLLAIVLPLRQRMRREADRYAEQSLELSKLSMIATLTSNAAIVTDLGGRIEWVNAGFERISGYTLAEVRGRKPGEVLQCADTDPATVADLSRAVREYRPIRCKILNQAKDGRKFWLDLEIQPLLDRDGAATGFMAVESDITEVVTLAAEMRQKNTNLEMMSRLANIGVWTFEPATERLGWSDQMKRIHDVDDDFVPELATANKFFPAGARDTLLAAGKIAEETGQPFELRLPLVTAKGNSRWVLIHGAPVTEGGKVTKMLGAMQDVTETVAALEQINDTNERLEMATDSAHIGLWDWNVADDIFWTNPRWWDYLGFQERQGDVSDEIADKVIHPEDLPRVRANRAAFLRDMPERLINEFRHRDGKGEWRWIISTGRVTSRREDGTVARISGVYIDNHERVLAAEKIAHAAHHDVLTGLANRAELRKCMREALDGLASDNGSFSVFVMDLDRFKAINDTFGHATGDAVLRAVATRIRANVRDGDVVARLGGDEFAILVRIAEQQREQSSVIAARLLEAISAPYEIDGLSLHIGVSIGIAMAPDHGNNADTLIRNADSALYKVKANGKNAFCFFNDQLEAEAQERRELESDLRGALARSEFELHYQPVVRMGARTIEGAEALLRWRHPQRGLISPDIFIPIAEETGLIIPIGEWVIERACAEATLWPIEATVAVNLSTAQLGRTDLVGVVTRALLDANLAPHRLELEVTESIFLRNDDALLSDLHQLHDIGIRLALDDFGTGYSSLGYLRKLPFDKIKIDKSFVHDLGTDAQSAAIICAVANLARSLDMDTTAEGVETEEQAQLVAAAGCTLAQGYYFGHPVPSSRLDFRGVTAEERVA